MHRKLLNLNVKQKPIRFDVARMRREDEDEEEEEDEEKEKSG